MPPAIQRADAALRNKVLWTLAAGAVAGGALILWVEQQLARMRLLSAEAPFEVINELHQWLDSIVILTGGLLLLAAAVLVRQGNRIKRDRRFPPTATRVLRDTPVLEGDAAMHRANASYVLASFCVVGAVTAGMVVTSF